MKRWIGIWTAMLVMAFATAGCSQQPYGQSDSGWVTLLDGPAGLDNWTPFADANWRIVDGVLQADKRTGKAAGLYISKGSYRDFQLRAEFWVDATANSGIYIRCSDPKKISSATAYEVNIFDTRPDPTYGTGAIVNVAKVSPMPKAGGKWNTMEVTAKGPRMTVYLNGVQTSEGEDSKFASGPIALQYGQGIVKFRKIQIKPL